MNDGQERNSAFISALNRRVASEYSVLLDSLSIQNNVVFNWGSWKVEVDMNDFARSMEEIANYEKSGRIERPKSRFGHIRFQKINVFYFFSVLIAMGVFHAVVYLYPELDLLQAGRSSASAITDGAFFRAITALTLHADIKHVASNIFFGGIAVYSLSTLIGTGYAWFLFLISGFAGNVFNAYFYGSGHNSIGASTAVFGVVGVLSGLQFFEKFREKKMRAWVPFGAAIGLLAMLGTSEKTDVLAHFFGFLSGIPLGLMVGKIYSKHEIAGKYYQALFMLVFWLVIAMSWMIALIG
ncbi:MAG TPA: rhomboid family intramembrane serine protease [bacterium]|nr:rhomboid family intramembrane serine protease [bacterium]HPS29673.1 rhomboid family intramembrane serine protease [bacterium]